MTGMRNLLLYKITTNANGELNTFLPYFSQVKSLINGARQVAKFHIKKQYKDALLLEFCEEFDR